MKRDMDLVRKILFEIEEKSENEDDNDIKLEGYTEDQINYHLIILEDAGLVNAKYSESINGMIYWDSIRLTWNGHEFLDAARDQKRWEKAKGAMAQVGGFALDVMKQLLLQYLKQELSLPN